MTNTLQRKADIIKAMGHPVRLEMLYALREGERCVCRLQELSGLDMSTVSRHLSVLKNAGLVTARKDKNWIFYTLACPCALDFADCLEK